MAGGRIYFDESSAELNDLARQRLTFWPKNLAGKMQKIEIRGHSSHRSPAAGTKADDPWDISYARCRAVRDFLVSKAIDPRRIRLGVAGEYEPIGSDGDPVPAKKNARVEIRALDEYLPLPAGTANVTATVAQK